MNVPVACDWIPAQDISCNALLVGVVLGAGDPAIHELGYAWVWGSTVGGDDVGLRDASCQVGGKHRSLVDLEVDTGEVRRNRAILKCPGCVYPTECNVCIGSVERGCLQGGALVVADGDHGIAALVDQLLNVRRVRRVINSGRVGRLEPFSLECLAGPRRLTG